MRKLSMLFPEKAKVHVTDKVNCIALTVQVKVMVVSHSGSDWLICYPVWSQRKVQGLYVPGASERPCYISQWPHQPLGFPGGSDGKEFTCNEGDLDLIPGLGRYPWRKEQLPTPVFWPGESPWTEEPGGLQSTVLQRDTTEQLSSDGGRSGVILPRVLTCISWMLVQGQYLPQGMP